MAGNSWHSEIVWTIPKGLFSLTLEPDLDQEPQALSRQGSADLHSKIVHIHLLEYDFPAAPHGLLLPPLHGLPLFNPHKTHLRMYFSCTPQFGFVFFLSQPPTTQVFIYSYRVYYKLLVGDFG